MPARATGRWTTPKAALRGGECGRSYSDRRELRQSYALCGRGRQQAQGAIISAPREKVVDHAGDILVQRVKANKLPSSAAGVRAWCELFVPRHRFGVLRGFDGGVWDIRREACFRKFLRFLKRKRGKSCSMDAVQAELVLGL